MATTLHLCGVKTPSQIFSKSKNASRYQPMQFQRLQHFDFAVSLPPWLPSVSSHCSSLRLRCEGGQVDVLERSDTQNHDSDQTPSGNELTCVMKFGGSSVASAERMREVADLILSFPEERPVIVLSAMGKTTNKLLSVFVYLLCLLYPIPSFITGLLIMRFVLQAGEKAVSCGVSKVSDLEELAFIKDLHLRFLGFIFAIFSSGCFFHGNIFLKNFCFFVIRTTEELGVESAIISSE